MAYGFCSRIGWGAGPFYTHRHYDAQRRYRQKQVPEIGLHRYAVEVIKRRTAFGIDVFWLYQSPGIGPGGTAVQRIVRNGIGIILRYHAGSHAALANE